MAQQQRQGWMQWVKSAGVSLLEVIWPSTMGGEGPSSHHSSRGIRDASARGMAETSPIIVAGSRREGELEEEVPAGHVPRAVAIERVNEEEDKDAIAAAKEKREKVKDALSTPQFLSRLAYFSAITVWTTFLFQRPLPSTWHRALTRSEMRLMVAGMGTEMTLGFIAVTVAHHAVLLYHTVQTSAPMVSATYQFFGPAVMWFFTSGWMAIYTIHIPYFVYRPWLWGITGFFILANYAIIRTKRYLYVSEDAIVSL